MQNSTKNAPLNAAQCRAARGWLDWTQDRLAEASGVSKRAIATFEAGSAEPRRATVLQLRQALEAQGIVFEPEGGVTLAP